jgi:hypothetical protein
MPQIFELAGTGMTDIEERARAADAQARLEAGSVVFMPQLPFTLEASEQRFLSPTWSERGAKNISYDPAKRELRHASAEDNRDSGDLATMMHRFAEQSRAIVSTLCAGYGESIRWGLTSFRPLQITGRSTSPKKDDTRLHVDAFASRPTAGLRILRVFANVNPHGEPRVWEIGEPFENLVAQFKGRIRAQSAMSAWLLEQLHITKTRRTAYDDLMLKLHDGAKLDASYQQSLQRTRFDFPAGSTWVVFTDYVMHAALSGQYLLEQTFYVPVEAMREPSRAPLRILESVYERPLT